MTATSALLRDDAHAKASILNDFSPKRLARTLVVGFISGIILVTLTISLAALVFRGPLAADLPLGVGIGLAGTLVIGLVSVFGSSFDGVVAGIQDNTAAIIGAAAAAIAATVPAEQAVPTVLAFIVTTSVVAAIVLGGIGVFRLGSLVRYIPYPVIGGFLVATGVLILEGARAILFEEGSALLSFDSVMRWLPGLAIGIAAFVFGRFQRTRDLLPWLIAGSLAATHVVFAASGINVDTAEGRGWLLGSFADGSLWDPSVLGQVADADWGAVLGQGGAMATVVAVAAISLMIKVHAIDQAAGEDIDIDRELFVAGLSTAAAAPVGGMPGYMHFTQTLMLRRLAGPHRGPALVAVLTAGFVMILGGSVLRLVPTSLIGGLLVYLGISFLVEWLWDMRSRLERSDYALVVGAGGAVVVLGFLPAIALGTVVAVVLFVVRYSRVDAVRHSYTLKVFRSSIERPPAQAAVLEEIGDEAIVLEVHGFLFFGTAYTVFTGPAMANADRTLRYAVFDLSRVTGVDSSASMALSKLARRGISEGFEIVLAGVPAVAADLVAQLEGSSGVVHRFPSLDAAVEWCEERLLALHPRHGPGEDDLMRFLDGVLGSSEHAATVLGYFTRHDYQPGEIVLEYGAATSGLYLIESGNLTARLKTADGELVRLRTMQPGTLIGEISLYLGGATTAEVVAEGSASVYHLPPEALAAIEKSDPAAAAPIHRLAARTLAGRVLHAERALRTFRS